MFEDKEDLEMSNVKIFEKEQNTESAIFSDKSDSKSIFQKSEIMDNDDKKLYAPPPGESGNPQKIVVTLNNSSNIVLLLLLSAFSILYYSWKSRSKTVN